MLYTLLLLATSAINIYGLQSVDNAVSIVMANTKYFPYFEGSPNFIKGTIKLQKTDIDIYPPQTRIFGEIIGLKKNAIYGFHVHEFGDISSDKHGIIDCRSTGAHYNPFGKLHGGPNDDERHVGDLGNIKSDKNGVAHINILSQLIQLNGETSVIGRSFVIHELMDDLSPNSTTGNAGGRLACGVIGIAQSITPTTTTTQTPTDNDDMACIGQYKNNNKYKFITDNNALIAETNSIKCREWIIKDQQHEFECDAECFSIEITNPNIIFEHQYLGSDIVGPNGYLSDVITKNELWTIGLVSEVGVQKYVLLNQETNQFLCAQMNLIQTKKLLQFEANGDNKRCHWQFQDNH